MNIEINGQTVAMDPDDWNISKVLDARGFKSTKGLAVAINDAIIPKGQWEQTSISDNDKILIITATQGG